MYELIEIIGLLIFLIGLVVTLSIMSFSVHKMNRQKIKLSQIRILRTALGLGGASSIGGGGAVLAITMNTYPNTSVIGIFVGVVIFMVAIPALGVGAYIIGMKFYNNVYLDYQIKQEAARKDRQS